MVDTLLEFCVPTFNTIVSFDIVLAWPLPSFDWGMGSVVGGMAEFFACGTQGQLTSMQRPPLFKVNTERARTLDKVFSERYIFPDLRAVKMSFQPQIGQHAETMKGYKERWSNYRWRLQREVNAAFVKTRKSDRVTLNVVVPKKLIVCRRVSEYQALVRRYLNG